MSISPSKSLRNTIIFLIIAVAAILIIRAKTHDETPVLPRVAIANLGPHASLENDISGIIAGLQSLGFRDGTDIIIETSHVNFDLSLIPQMLAKLTARQPKVLVALTTPVAQAARAQPHGIPLVFSAITDPSAADLTDKPEITGASDAQDLEGFLRFAQQLLPQAKTIGMLYSSSEANDQASLARMQEAARKSGMELLAVPLAESRDIPIRMEAFRGKADFFYTLNSAAVQAGFPAILSAAAGMNLPLFDFDEASTRQHQALGSYAVSYRQVGYHTAEQVAAILRGQNVSSLAISYPGKADHRALVSAVQLERFKLPLPNDPSIVVIAK
jgi:putative ABC transport system substrate-binding protein